MAGPRRRDDLGDASGVLAARALSDQAIDEFESLSDKQRKYLNRAHLEIVPGELETARALLAHALRCAHPTHTPTAPTNKVMPVRVITFPVLQWFRSGAAISLPGAPAKRADYQAACDDAGLNSPPLTDGDTYRTADIRRYLAATFEGMKVIFSPRRTRSPNSWNIRKPNSQNIGLLLLDMPHKTTGIARIAFSAPIMKSSGQTEAAWAAQIS